MRDILFNYWCFPEQSDEQISCVADRYENERFSKKRLSTILIRWAIIRLRIGGNIFSGLFHGSSWPDPPIKSGGSLNLAGGVGSRQEAFQISRVESGRVTG